MHLMASKFGSTEIQNLYGETSDGHIDFVIQAQPYLFAAPLPKAQEAHCFKASTHYPTLFDNFQRELRDILLQHQKEGYISDWRSTESWMLMKELAKSAEHRAATSKTKTPVMHNTLDISIDKTRLMQTKIDNFVKKMTDLQHIERDAELEFTQEELDATSMMDVKSRNPVRPVEYLVTHGQAQEQCDTICNLKVISSSTGLTGQHLVSLADAVTYENNWHGPFYKLHDVLMVGMMLSAASVLHPIFQRNLEAMMLLQKGGLQKRNAFIGVVATLFGDKEDLMGLEKNNVIDWGESKINGESLLGYNYNFDSFQSKALALALNKKRPVLVTQGPPGTGKTGLLDYLIQCVVRHGERVLVTAPSNAAVDNILEKLSSFGLNFVRLGI